MLLLNAKPWNSPSDGFALRQLELPFPNDSYDRVVTSLVLHHLSTRSKQKALAEIYRVLRPGGQVQVVDFGPPHSPYARFVAPLIRNLEEVAGQP